MFFSFTYNIDLLVYFLNKYRRLTKDIGLIDWLSLSCVHEEAAGVIRNLSNVTLGFNR